MSVEIGLDYFPARVTLPSGAELGPCRVFVADGRVQVWVLRDGKPEIYYDRELVSSSGSSARGFSLQVGDGEVRVSRDPGCGCGNPLRRYNPWPGERRRLVAL